MKFGGILSTRFSCTKNLLTLSKFLLIISFMPQPFGIKGRKFHEKNEEGKVFGRRDIPDHVAADDPKGKFR